MYSSYDDLLNGMTPEEILAEGAADVFDFPYEPLTDEDDENTMFYLEDSVTPHNEEEPIF